MPTIPPFRPAFDMPRTPAQAVAVLDAWGSPLCMTFSADRAKAAAELLRPALEARAPEMTTRLADHLRAVISAHSGTRAEVEAIIAAEATLAEFETHQEPCHG